MKLLLIFSLSLVSFSSFAGYHCGYLNETIDLSNSVAGAPFVKAEFSNELGKKIALEGKLTEALSEYFYSSQKFELMDTKGGKAELNVKTTYATGGRACSTRAGCNKMAPERISAKFTYLGIEHVYFCQKTAN